MSPQYTVVGTSFSTYVRFILMALEHLKADYVLKPTEFRSEELSKVSPFGKMPVLLVEGREKPMIETEVMRVFLDHQFPSNGLTPKGIEQQLQSTLWMSLHRDQVFPGLIIDVLIKVYMLTKYEGKTEEEAGAAVAEPLKRVLTVILPYLEGLLKETSTNGDYLVGDSLTWADLLLYPAFHTAFNTPLAEQLKAAAPGLFAWYSNIAKLEIAKKTNFP
ncbi:hypothetical protein BC940DRAFT_288775 [Gongronella butleri]|nr:hypothetical protein BC940DRAFT_288775 [Gongronella butleri]